MNSHGRLRAAKVALAASLAASALVLAAIAAPRVYTSVMIKVIVPMTPSRMSTRPTCFDFQPQSFTDFRCKGFVADRLWDGRRNKRQ